MSAKKSSGAESREPVDVEPILSSDSQKDLADALDETPSAEDVKRTWVEENRRDLDKAFERGKKVDPVPQDSNVEILNAVERTEKDLRYVLGVVFDKYGALAMYDKGIDNLAHHWVVGYQSIRGQQTVQKVMLYVSGTEWTRSCGVLDNLAAMAGAEDPGSADADDWTVV